jgi:hypothetical protein
MPKSPRSGSPPPEGSPVPLGSRQSFTSSQNEKVGHMRVRSSSVPAFPRGGSSSKDTVQAEPNLRIVIKCYEDEREIICPEDWRHYVF